MPERPRNIEGDPDKLAAYHIFTTRDDTCDIFQAVHAVREAISLEISLELSLEISLEISLERRSLARSVEQPRGNGNAAALRRAARNVVMATRDRHIAPSGR